MLRSTFKDVLFVFLSLTIGILLGTIGGLSVLSERENELYRRKINLQLAKSIRYQLESTENLTFQFLANRELNKSLEAYTKSPDLYQIAPFNSIFSSFLESQTLSHPLLRDAVFFDIEDPKRKPLTMSENLSQIVLNDIKSSPFYQNIVKLDGKFYWETNNVINHNGKKSLIGGRLIKKVDGERNLGVLVLFLRSERLSEMINSELYVDGEPTEYSIGNYFNMIVSASGTILASPLKSYTGRNIKELLRIEQPTKLMELQSTGVIKGVWRTERVYIRMVPIHEAGIFLWDMSTLPGKNLKNRAFILIGISLVIISLFLLRRIRIQSTIVRKPSLDNSPYEGLQEAWKRFQELPPREREILLYLAKGLSNKEIAYKLRLQEQTVKNYIHDLYNKLGIHDRVSAALFVNRIQNNENNNTATE